MRVALDTNILAYAEGLGDALRCSMAVQLLEQLHSAELVLPAQTLGELSRVLTGKAKRTPLAVTRGGAGVGRRRYHLVCDLLNSFLIDSFRERFS